MTDEPLQLDLTSTITDVPQANSLPLFIRLVDAVDRDVKHIGELAELLEVEERTIHYYVDFGKWLGLLLVSRPGEVEFTEIGATFADSVAARQRLFTHGMFSKPLIQTANALKRESKDETDVPTLETREALLRAIESMTKLAPTTAARRASGLAQMLDAAYRAGRIDWKTGEPLTAYKNVTFDIHGRTFLTAMAARQFSSKSEFRIGFPLQVLRFVSDQGHHLNTSVWKRASLESADGKAVWFGSIPVSPSTIEIAERGGRDLRKLAVMCAPYVTLAVACLSYRDALKRPSVRVTHDMYGYRFWEHDKVLGSPIEVVEKLAAELGLVATAGVPRKLSHEADDLTEVGGDKELIDVLLKLKILREKDTSYEVAPGFESELREGSESSTSVVERLQTIHEALDRVLRAETVD